MKVAVKNLGKNATHVGRKIASPVTKRVRDRAIKRTEERIAEAGVDISSLSEEELEILVCEAEEKCWNDIKGWSMGALMLALGIS